MMNKQIGYITGVSENDYKQWCKDNKKAAHKPATKREFFERIADGRLVRDSKSGQLIKARRKK